MLLELNDIMYYMYCTHTYGGVSISMDSGAGKLTILCTLTNEQHVTVLEYSTIKIISSG